MSSMIAPPSRLLLQPSRLAMHSTQRQLSDAQAEASTGRYANLPLALGSDIGSDIGLRLQLAGFEQDLDNAKQAKAKAGVLQTSLSSLTELTSGFRSTLTGARGSASGQSLAANAAAMALASMRETLNTTYDGQYLFAGLNFATAPINGYDDGPRDAIVSAFTSDFGFPPDDPAAASLSPAQISDFLDGNFKSLFEGVAWSTDWSNAADETVKVRLGSDEEIDAAASTNAPFAQKMAAAFGMIDVLGRGKLSQGALQTVIDKSLSLVSEAQVAIGDEQSRIGAGENRIAAATTNLAARKDRFASSLQTLEGVDSYEAATRINLLMSQLEASYSLTARISKMNLLSYI